MKLTNNLYFYPEKGMLDCNTYVIRGSPGIIIDPGSAELLPELVRELQRDGIEPGEIGVITNTHLHGDHCWANEAFKELSGAEIAIHPSQQQFYDLTVNETARFFGFQPVGFTADRSLDGQQLSSGEMAFDLLHSPGHSPDSICFYSPAEKVLICGDVLFDQNTGRADLPGGNAAELKQSIERLSRLEVEYLLPGHMATVCGAARVQGNFDFIREQVFRWL